MYPNQYPLQQAYKPGQEYSAQGQEGVPGAKIPTPEIAGQGYMTQTPQNTGFPVETNKQAYNYPNPTAPQGQYYSYPYTGAGFPDQQGVNNSNPQILQALSYLQNPVGQANPTGNTPQTYTAPYTASAYTQGQGQGQVPQTYSAYMGFNNAPGQGEQGSKGFDGYQANKFHRGEGSFRGSDRGDRGDRGGNRGDRGDKGYRNDRGNRGYRDERGNRDDRDRDRDRSDRGDRGDRSERRGGRDDRGDRGERRFDNNDSRDRRGDNHQRDRSRRSRSNSREFEKKDAYSRKPGYKEREGNDRYGNRDNFNKSNNRFPPRGDFNDRKNESGSDWKCIQCGNVNWAKRDACNRCQVKKPENAPVVPRDSNNRSTNSFPSRGGFNSRPHHSVNNYKKEEFRGSNFRNNPDPQPQTERDV